MVSEQGLQKFIDLYENKYSVKLSKQQAFDNFSKLIRIVKITLEPNPNLEKNNKYDII